MYNKKFVQKKKESNVMTVEEFVKTVNGFVPNTRTEFVDNIQDICDKIKNMTYKMYINMKYEHPSCLNNNFEMRFILSSKKELADQNSELVQYSNGIIFAMSENGCRVICRPMRDLITSRVNIDAGYTIYRIQEGTTVNMYFYKGQWVISTRSGFDMREVTWRGEKTYGTIVREVLGDYDFSVLDQNTTYTFGFRHPDLHPFDSASGQAVWNIGTPAMPNISAQTVVTDIIDLHASAARGLEDYIAGVRPYNLGYIARYNGPDKTKNPDVIIESTLLTTIRKLIYDLPSKTAQSTENFKSMDYVVLENFMDFRRRELFQKIFPEFSDKMNYYRELFDDVVTKVHTLMVRYEELYISGSAQKSHIVLDFPNETVSDKLVHFYYPIVRNIITAYNNTSIAKLISDIIISSKYTPAIYQYF
jgi:hypothetical protein